MHPLEQNSRFRFLLRLDVWYSLHEMACKSELEGQRPFPFHHAIASDVCTIVATWSWRPSFCHSLSSSIETERKLGITPSAGSSYFHSILKKQILMSKLKRGHYKRKQTRKQIKKEMEWFLFFSFLLFMVSLVGTSYMYMLKQVPLRLSSSFICPSFC